jgi:RND family efflux transporter MFP subunit
MTSNRNLIGLVALVAAALIFMLWLAGLLHWGKIPPGTVALKAPAAAGRVFKVAEVELPQELTVMATVISQSLAQVSSQVPGKVSRIWVEAGSRVAKGDRLLELAAPEFQARYQQAQASASQAQAHLAQVAADYARYQRLLKEGAVSPREFEAMEAGFKAAQAAAHQAQAQVKEAAAFRGYTQIFAPLAGVVAERRVAVGDLAQPGHPLVSLYDPGLLQLEGEVNDSYREQLKVGETVRVAVPAVNYQAELPLVELFPISAPGSRTFKVRTAMVQNHQLIPGMFARLTLSLGTTRGLVIPQAAVRLVGQLPMVETVVDGRASRRQVKLGREIGDKVEVLAGLQAGDQVLLP